MYMYIFFKIKNYFYFVFACVGVPMGATRVLDSQELELQDVVSYLIWVEGTEFRSPGKALHH